MTQTMTDDIVTIVSGLPRSGTSLMMQMLAAGGLPLLTDAVRSADEDNPRGYYEYEPVKKIKADPALLEPARGKVVKVISELLLHVPPRYPCKVVFMQRAMGEVLASQQRMLERRGRPSNGVSDAEIATLFAQHLRRVEEWIARQPHMEALYISYNELLRAPTPHVAALNRFLGGSLDEAGMLAVIDRQLYRQRSS